jgi:hypothetical protein
MARTPNGTETPTTLNATRTSMSDQDSTTTNPGDVGVSPSAFLVRGHDDTNEHQNEKENHL